MELSSLFERDLNKLTEEISLYKNPTAIWEIKEGISNSAGNLTLHLLGNLNYYIGAALANTGYVRERDKEFSLKDIPQEQLIGDLKQLAAMVTRTLSSLPEDDLTKDFPVQLNDKTFSTEFVLMHLLAHLNYHLGQINYHRRLLD